MRIPAGQHDLMLFIELGFFIDRQHSENGARLGGEQGFNIPNVTLMDCLGGLQVRMRVRRRKRLSLHRGSAPVPEGLDEGRSMEFVHDQLSDGRPIRMLTVIDQWSRESVLIEPDFRMSGQLVADALDAASKHRALPQSIRVDHGTEFTSKAPDEWAWQRGVQFD